MQEANINQTVGSPVVYPDYVVFGGELLVGWNRKTSGEILSSLDAVEEQLTRELAGPVEWLALGIEGSWRPDGTGGCWGYSLDWSKVRPFQKGDMGFVTYKQRHYNTPWKAVKAWEMRLSQLGVAIFPTVDVYDTASQLVALHDLVMKSGEHKTLNRLIKQNYVVSALDRTERDLALSLMGLQGARIGEELALSLAQYYNSITEIIRLWDGGGSIAEVPLRNGSRRVGHAAENNLKAALGYRSPTPELSGQGSAERVLFTP